jgi:acyl-CoA dehydrogenase
VLAVVDTAAPGVTVTAGVLVDGHPVATVDLDDVAVPDRALIAPAGGAAELVARTLRAGLAIRAAWVLGGLERALAITIEYLRDRHQFGVPIGAFQALQHRAARLHVEAQLAGAIVGRVLDALDEGNPRAPQLVHAAAARLSDAYVQIAEEGVQMHGGFGMTDEAEIGFHLKAATVAALDLGDAAYHRTRYAELAGF